MGKIRRAIGLMSGTSMDGIDVAAIETDGHDVVQRLAFRSFSYEPDFRQSLRTAIAESVALTDRTVRSGCLGEVERRLTDLHAHAVTALLDDAGWRAGDVAVIGFHGQTVLHRPEAGLTVQLGDGERLASELGIPVVCDLRAADVAAGGEGAPLASIYHRAMAAKVVERPVCVLNVGGVANLTWIGPDDELLAFDTGPGNALIDDWMALQADLSHDCDGAAAAAGTADHDIVDRLCRHPYFARRPPKSLDRDDFVLDAVRGQSLNDGAATLSAFTAAAIGKAREHLPQEPVRWFVSGGGRKNRTMMAMIGEAVESAVVPVEAIGFDGDSIEAEAWAYLAVRSCDGLAITFPGTTGVGREMTGGVLVA